MVTFNIQCKVCNTDKYVDIPHIDESQKAEEYLKETVLPIIEHRIVPTADNNFMSRNRKCTGEWDIKVALPE